MAAEQSIPLSLTISPKSVIFNSATDIVIVCELKNEGSSSLQITVPYYGSDHWIVDGCYGSLPVPAREEKSEVLKLEPKATFHFERRLKFNEENQLFLHTVDGKLVRERSLIDVLWKRKNVGSQPAFGSKKEYSVSLELSGMNVIGTAGTIRSNESMIKLR